MQRYLARGKEDDIGREQFIDFYDYISAVVSSDSDFARLSQRIWSKRIDLNR